MTTSHPVASYQTMPVLADVLAERARQDARFGRQDHPDGTGPDVVNPVSLAYCIGDALDDARQATDRALSRGTVTFADILTEEAFEALAETDPAQLRAELVQVAASAVCWIEALDRRAAALAAIEHADDCTGCDGPGVMPCAADEVRGGFAMRDGVPIKDLREGVSR
ncbi:hypothetical protein AB0L41_42850 [Amycolatopsis mediterranei]|uniref:hypothetical protein n=1 Tax=Amycolatopsis mediterranei TaxID=33910 RepID=UPI003447A82B